MERGRVFRAAWPRGSRPRMLTAVLAAAALSVLVVLAAGCGGGSSNGVANTGSNTTTQSAAPASGGNNPGSAQTANATNLVKYAQCMRAHGLPSFPDPVNGHLQLTFTKGGPLDPASPQYKAAQQACKSVAPGGMFGGGGQPSTAMQTQMLRFASCMRKNGVPNFPDPHNGGFLLTVDPNSPGFKHARQACQSLLPAGPSPATP
jgi:hypothetical protein